MPIGMDTYLGANDLRESLLAILKDVSPLESNYFTSNLGKAPSATNTYHEWNTYYEARPTSVTPRAEGAAESYADLTAEGRTGNYTAIVDAPVKVTRTMASVATVTGEDEVTKQKNRAIKRLKARMEYITIHGSASAGASGVARSMAGIIKCISTLVSKMASGVSFAEVYLNDMMQDSWNQVGDEYVANILVAPAVIKRRVAGFGTNLTRNINASDKRLTKEVRVYDTELGPTIMVIAHKDMLSAAGTVQTLLMNDEVFQHSFLVDSGEPHWEDRAKDDDNTKGVYLTEMTLASFAQRSSVFRSGWCSTL